MSPDGSINALDLTTLLALVQPHVEHIFIFQTPKSPAHSVFIAGEGEVLVFAMAENSISCRKQLRPRCKRERDIGARSAAFPTAENPRQNAPLKESLGRGDLVASSVRLVGGSHI